MDTGTPRSPYQSKHRSAHWKTISILVKVQQYQSVSHSQSLRINYPSFINGLLPDLRKGGQSQLLKEQVIRVLLWSQIWESKHIHKIKFFTSILGLSSNLSHSNTQFALLIYVLKNCLCSHAVPWLGGLMKSKKNTCHQEHTGFKTTSVCRPSSQYNCSDKCARKTCLGDTALEQGLLEKSHRKPQPVRLSCEMLG